jgi:type IV pilus assembly protein PilM
MARSSAVWGIDIGQCAVKALRCRSNEDASRITVDAFDYIEYPKILSQADADAPQLIRDALTQFLSRNSVRGDRVAVSVSGQSGLARFIKLPPVEAKKIPDIVKYEARQQIPFALEDVVWDYQQMAGGSVEDGFSMETEVGLFAMKRDQVAKALRPFNEAKIEVDVVQLAPLAVYNYIIFDRLQGASEEGGPPPSVVVLSMGTDTTDLVVTNGFRVWQRSIPLGGSHFTKALTKELKLTFAKAEHVKRNVQQAEDPKVVFQAMKNVFNDLVTEVQRSINFFKSVDRNAKIGQIVALGNAMKLPGLQKFLSQHLGFEVETISSYRGLVGDGVVDAPAFKENLPSFAVVYGLGLQGLDRGRLRTNLMPREIIKTRIIRAKKPWAVAGVAALAAGCLVNYAFHWQAWAGADTKKYSQEFSAADAVVADAGRFATEFEAAKTKYADVTGMGKEIVGNAENRLVWMELLTAINSALPTVSPEESKALEADPHGMSKRKELRIMKMESEYFSEDKDLGAWLEDTKLSRPAMNGMGGGAAADPFADASDESTEEETTSEEGAEATETAEAGPTLNMTPTGNGWVIELRGYHYFNPPYNDNKRLYGAEFVRQTLLKELAEGKVMLPTGEKVAGPNGTQVDKLEEVTFKELGIMNPVFRLKSGPVKMQIPDPKAALNAATANQKTAADGTQPAATAEGQPAAAAPATPAAPGAEIDPSMAMIDLNRYDFSVQFAWKPTPRSQRLLNKAAREKAAADAAAAAAAAPAEGEGDGAEAPAEDAPADGTAPAEATTEAPPEA